MRKIISGLFTILILLTGVNVYAQESFNVKMIDDEWYITHTVQEGETIFSLARKYHVPAAMLADANRVTFQDVLKEGRRINVPLGAFNLAGNKQINENDKRKLYYVVDNRDNLFRISHYARVSQRQMKDWNSLGSNDVETGQKLFVGWVMYDATELPPQNKTVTKDKDKQRTVVADKKVVPDNTKTIKQNGIIVNTEEEKVDEYTTVIRIPATDTLAEYVPASPEEEKYLLETNNGLNVVTEKGPAVFFDMKGSVSGGTIYAFHNAASRGSIIKVHNPGTGRTIYVKVLGPMPETPQYHNSLIGISGLAKEELGVTEDKVWTELSYAGY